jgi:hypothetical protein
MTELCASIFDLAEPSRKITVRDLWTEIAHDVASEFDETYLYHDDWRYRIVVRETACASPDRAIVRYRTIEASIRRQSGRSTLLDLSAGNLFAPAHSKTAETLHVVNDPRYAQWARHAGQISLQEHVRLVEQFAGHIMDAGWMLEKPKLAPFSVRPPMVRNNKGECLLPTKGFSQLARHPAIGLPAGSELIVVCANTSVARRAVTSLQQAWNRLFLGCFQNGLVVRHAPSMVSSAINLFLLEDHDSFDERSDLRNMLRQAESAGYRFKLAKIGTLAKSFPVQNIVYDLFLIAGGKPWVAATEQPEFCSIDAGHSKELCKSRWVKVESDFQQRICDIRVIMTPLAEHVPKGHINDLWPSQSEAIACRDGKLSQERGIFEARAAKENRHLIEVKKSPKAILWRAGGTSIRPSEFGDALIDEHADVLIQTVPQNVRDYIHPVRLSANNTHAVELATAFLHQHAMPGLSLFYMSRLPGTLYLADLISKLTTDGWPKVIGRGFRLPTLVP